MSRHFFAMIAVLAICIPASGESLAQARGPSAKQIQEAGQQVESMVALRRQQWERDWGLETKASEREDMRRDAARSAARLAELDAFLRGLTGRFRIEGRIERIASVMTRVEGPCVAIGCGVSAEIRPVQVSAKVTGVADCTSIGTGAGVNCLISASWPPFDRVGEPPRFCRRIPYHPWCQLLDPDFSAGELLDTLRPAVLALGLDTDPPQLRGMMVTADSLSNEWVGKLEGNTARLLQTEFCTTLRCYVEFGISTSPDGQVVTLTFQQKMTWMVTLTLVMHRDPQAALEKSLSPMRAR